MAGASGQKRVPLAYISGHEFLLPPTREQERIVAKLDAALSRLERAENAARRAQKRLKEYRSAVQHAATTGELTRDWRASHVESEQDQLEAGGDLLKRLLAVRRSHWEKSELERLRSDGTRPRDDKWKSRYSEPVTPDTTDMPELPKSWTWASLEMIAEIGSGISVSQNRRVEDPVQLRIYELPMSCVDILISAKLKPSAWRKRAQPITCSMLTIFSSPKVVTETSLGGDGYGKVKLTSVSIKITFFVLAFSIQHWPIPN